MKVHELKTELEQYNAIVDGRKTAEFRRNDRDFEVGDKLVLRKWDDDCSMYVGPEFRATITHVLTRGYGMPEGFAMLSFRTEGEDL